jgi:hypothetical protein
MTLVRVGAATALSAAAVGAVPWQGKLATLVLAAVAVGLYVVALAALGEVGPDERRALWTAVRRRWG